MESLTFLYGIKLSLLLRNGFSCSYKIYSPIFSSSAFTVSFFKLVLLAWDFCWQPRWSILTTAYLSHWLLLIITERIPKNGTGIKTNERPMKEDRELRSKFMCIWSTDIQQGSRKCTKGNNILFNKWCWENCISICKRIELKLCFHTQKRTQNWLKA